MAMPIQLTWHTSFDMSCMHAMSVLVGRVPLANAELTADLYPIVKELRSRLMHDKLEEPPFLEHLVPLAGEHPSERDLAAARWYTRCSLSIHRLRQSSSGTVR